MALNNEIGSFAWFCLMTHSVEKANAFYRDALGWTLSDYEIPGMGKSTIYAVGESQFASPVPLEGDTKQLPSHWISYIAVADVDASCAQVETLGGKICSPPFDMPTIGRTAVVTDPVGAAFHLYTPERKDQPVNVIGNAPGQMCWVELMVEDTQAVIPFYREIFGWTIERAPMEQVEYHSVQVGEDKVAGIMKRPADVPAMPPTWMPYIAVSNLKDANAKAQEHGAKLLMERMEIPQTGVFSLIQDPSGAHTYLFEWQAQA